jgi:hypothetical protein
VAVVETETKVVAQSGVVWLLARGGGGAAAAPFGGLAPVVVVATVVEVRVGGLRGDSLAVVWW